MPYGAIGFENQGQQQQPGVMLPPWMQQWGGVAGAVAGGATPPQTDAQMFMSLASPQFIGLQGAPGLQDMNLGQGGIDWGKLQQMLALTSGAPGRIDQFQGQAQSQINRLGRQGHRAIDQQAAQQFASQASQLGYGQRMNQRTQGDAFAAMGMAPSSYQANVVPQQRMDLSAMLGQARGASSAGATAAHQGLREDQFGRNMGLQQSVLNARNQLEQYYDAMMLQKYMAEIAAQAQMSAAGKTAKASKFGDILGIGGAIFGGPIGAGIGKFLGDLF